MPKKIKPLTEPSKPPANEHIFPASKLEPLAIRWKELHDNRRHAEAMVVLEQIIIGSTAMFNRLAQHEDFHFTVDLPILISAAQEKVVKWLIRWQPKKGRLFSWFSKCAKHAFLSELVKVNQFRRRYHVTSENLERFYGADDHEINKHDIAKEYTAKLHELTCRWGDPQEIGAIRYVVECVVDDSEHDKQMVIRAAAFAYGISFEQAKFFYSWALVGMRQIFYEKAHVSFTEQDLLRAAQSYSLFIDMLDVIGVDKATQVIKILGGTRIKIPTIDHIKKLKEDYLIYREIDQSDLDPESVADVAKKHKRSVKSAQEVFTEMSKNLDPRRYGEYDVYGENDNHHSG